jgi:hypothetical protein
MGTVAVETKYSHDITFDVTHIGLYSSMHDFAQSPILQTSFFGRN